MYDNPSEFIAATIREDAQAWAATRAEARAVARHGLLGTPQLASRRVAIANALVALATRLAPTLSEQPERPTAATAAR